MIVVVDVFAEWGKGGVISEKLYSDDLVLISETINGFRYNFS